MTLITNENVKKKKAGAACPWPVQCPSHHNVLVPLTQLVLVQIFLNILIKIAVLALGLVKALITLELLFLWC